MIFGINTTSDIAKLLYVISHDPWGEWNLRQFWNITSGIYAKYHLQIKLLFVYTNTHKRFVIFTCRYSKLSWNTTALSQPNCRHFSWSSIIRELQPVHTAEYAAMSFFLSNWLYSGFMKCDETSYNVNGLFIRRWETPGRWGNPLRWGNRPVHPLHVTSPIWDLPPPCRQALSLLMKFLFSVI